VTLVCTLELDKQGGMTLSVADSASKAAQTIVLDGKSLKLSVTDGALTSTITQTASKISIECSDFAVDATSITLNAKQTLKLESMQMASVVGNQKLELAGKLQAALSGASVGVKADGMLTAEAGGLAKLSAASVTVG
jgi:hypothetical protein